MNKLAFSILLVLFTTEIMAQTEPLWTMFQHNPIFYNATLTGNDSQYTHALHVQYRNQWPETGSGFKTLQAAYTQPWKKSNSVLGGFFLNDRAGGMVINNRIGALYHYKLDLSSKTNVRFGINAYYLNEYLDVSKIKWGASPPVSLKSTLITYGISTGISFYCNNFYIGIAENFIKLKSFFSDADNWTRIFYLNAGCQIHISDRFSFIPSAVYKHQASTKLLQMNVTGLFYNRIEAGITYREFFQDNLNPYCINIGVRFLRQKAIIGYSYDFHDTSSNWPSNTAHEMVLKFRF